MGEKIRREGAEQEAKGAKRELEGKIQKNVADAIDDESEQVEGAVKEAAGKAQRKVGETMRKHG